MKICIVTSTRADWGILSPLAMALRDMPEVELQIIATNMHLMHEYGYTIDEIERGGFVVNARVPMMIGDDSKNARVKAMSQCMEGVGDALVRLNPDIVVILGDRYEMLAVASAACVLNIPIAHIAGGEISEGAIDDSIRHAITKLSSLHFTATEEYRQRVIRMGESPERVFNTGALGVWNILNQPLMSREELVRDLNFEFEDKKLLLATFHPATLDTSSSAAEQCREMLRALDQMDDYKIIVTYPNNDTGSEEIIKELESWSKDKPNVKLIKSLGMKRYLSTVKYCAAVIGNSSSGIVEIPSMGVPTVDIGIRQKGRISGPSVIHVQNTAAEIYSGIRKALSAEFQLLAAKKENPYYKNNTLESMVGKLLQFDPQALKNKIFYDI